MASKDSLSVSIIDNDPFCRILYRQHIHNLGYSHVSTFSDEQACLNRLTASSTTEVPDIIFLDYCQEHMGSLDILRKIKRFNPDIYLVVLSGYEDRQLANDAIKCGAFDYIIKGDNDVDKIDEVLQKIEHVITLLQQRPSGGIPKLLTMIGLI